MPLKLLWQPRHERIVDVPYVLEIVGDDRRWEALPAFARWVVMEVKRIVWTRDWDRWKGE